MQMDIDEESEIQGPGDVFPDMGQSVCLSDFTQPLRIDHMKYLFIRQPHNPAQDLLKTYIRPAPHDTCPIHRCINWLSENKSCTTNFPSDIISEHLRKSLPLPISLPLQPGAIDNTDLNKKPPKMIRKLTDSFKKRFYPKKDLRKIFRKMAARKQEKKREKEKPKKPSRKKILMKQKKKLLFLLRLNFNTNRPCCNINRNQNDSPLDDVHQKLKKSYSHEFNEMGPEESLSESMSETDKSTLSFENSTTETKLTEKVQESTVRRVSLTDASEEKSESDSESEQIQSTNQPSHIGIPAGELEQLRRNRPTLDQLIDAHHRGQFKPPSHYSVSYKFYVYLYPSETDQDLKIFQRHELNRLAKSMEPEDARALAMSGMRGAGDFLRDRRVQMVQNQSDVQLELGGICCDDETNNTEVKKKDSQSIRGNMSNKSKMAFINGLPHRKITIYSTDFKKIARALSIMEETFPDLMRSAVFRDGIPCSPETAGRWSAGSLFSLATGTSSTRRKMRPRASIPGGGIDCEWASRIDPVRRHPFQTLSGRHRSFTCPLNRKKWLESRNPSLTGTNITKSRSRSKSKPPSLTSNKQSASSIYAPKVKYSRYHRGLSPLIHNSSTRYSQTQSTQNNTVNNANYIPNDTKIKKIRCPATILAHSTFKNGSVMHKIGLLTHCTISDLMHDPVRPSYVKFNVTYNNTTSLNQFCNLIGLKKLH